MRFLVGGMPTTINLLCRVPLEIRVQGEKEPIYELTLEDLGRANDQPVLPFNAYGTLAWARGEFDNNSASSQVRERGNRFLDGMQRRAPQWATDSWFAFTAHVTKSGGCQHSVRQHAT
jgi:hypothetical protein